MLHTKSSNTRTKLRLTVSPGGRCSIARTRKSLKDKGSNPLRWYRDALGKFTWLIDSSSESHSEHLEETKEWLYGLWRSGDDRLIKSVDAGRLYLELKKKIEDNAAAIASGAKTVWRECEREVIRAHRLLMEQAHTIEQRVSSMSWNDPHRDSEFAWALHLMEKAEKYWSDWESYWNQSGEGLRDETPGLSTVSNCHKIIPRPNLNPWMNRARRGSKGITPHQKRKARECVLLLEQKHDARCLSFGTLTIPTLPHWEDAAVASRWSDLIRKFMQKLKRQLERLGLNPQGVFANEIQQQRVMEWGVCGYHCHFVIQARANSGVTWALKAPWVERAWKKILENFLGHGVDTGAATQLIAIKKSAANYLSKYISKKESKSAIFETNRLTNGGIKSWVGDFGKLWSEVKDLTERFDGEVAEKVFDSIDNKTCDDLKWKHDKYIELPSQGGYNRSYKLWVCTVFEVKDREAFVQKVRRLKEGFCNVSPLKKYPLRGKCTPIERNPVFSDIEVRTLSPWKRWRRYQQLLYWVMGTYCIDSRFMPLLITIVFVGQYSLTRYPNLWMLQKLLPGLLHGATKSKWLSCRCSWQSTS